MTPPKDLSKINGLIFKELVKRGYSLEGNTRVWNLADSKLWYLTPNQAQAYLDLENSEDYKENVDNAEPELLETCIHQLKSFLEEGESINVVDLGCGDGKKAAKILKGLSNFIKVRYCPIDISAYMVQKAIKTVSELKIEEIVKSQWNISDFDNLVNITPLLRQGNFKRNVILLLGYTLGNFEIHELLHEIRSSMVGTDILVLIDGIGNSKWERRAEECCKDLKTDNFFRNIPRMLGLLDKTLKFGARFVNSRIEFFYDVEKDQKISFRNKKVEFKRGDRIIVAISSKNNKDELKSILNIYFDEARIYISKDQSTALAICRK
jgi:uncharacterized SAM-dependent methyltransferase